MLKIIPKRILASFLTAALAISVLPFTAFGKEEVNAELHPVVTDYLKDTDIITISPAENRDPGNSAETIDLEDSNGWSLTVQNNNCFNGDDLQMWQYGVSDKLRVWHYNHGGAPQPNSFWLCAVNWRETPSSRFVDIEGQSKKNGANVHVWSAKDKLADNKSKWFQIEQDPDNDPETYYIKNVNSGSYLAPENYYNTKKKYDERQCLSNGKNTVLSDQPFLWRIEVINRTPDVVKSQREWMKNINGKTPLSAINIPGTHDSSTANVEGSWNEGFNTVACQKYFIPELLEVGVRSFDLRMKYKDNDGLIMLHGQDWAVCHTEDTYNNARNLKFEDVMEYYKNYLKEHPSETIIATFKNDAGNEDRTTEEFKKVMAKYESVLYDWKNPNPTLDEVRGKIVGFSRMSKATGGIYGPDLSKWDERYTTKYNYGQLITDTDTKPEVYVQDNYSTDGSTKIQYVYKTAYEANEVDDSAEYTSFLFNYTSCTLTTPLSASRCVNQYIRSGGFRTYIDGKNRLGITVMDFIDAQLAKMIYQSNGEYGGNSEQNKKLINSKTQSSAAANYASARALDDSTSVYNGEDYKLTVTWPSVDPLMYGFSLKKAVFKGGSATITLSDGTEYAADGKFVFKDTDVYPTVSDTDSTLYTLTFVPLNSEYPVLEKDVTINIIKRPLNIKIGEYKQQYGDTAESWRDVVSVLGRVAEKDWNQLSAIDMVIEKDGTENVLDFNGNTTIADILPAELPIGSTGSVSVKYGDKTADDFPNYDMNVQASGTWEIVPRQLTIEWSGQTHYLSRKNVDVTAKIGNIYNNEDVDVRITTRQGKTADGVTEYTAIATLVGKDAANYEIPEYLSTFSYTLSASSKKVAEPSIRLSETSFVYDGTAKTPDVSVYDDGILIPSDEYTVEYSDNIKSGRASVTITDKTGGNYDLVFYDEDENEVNTVTLTFIIEGNGSSEFTKGDISGNDKIDMVDAIIISKYLMNMVEFSEEEMQIADYNEDGKVNINDAIGIAKYLLDNLQN